MSYTISTHNGSRIAWDHNIRNRNVTDKEAHIDRNGVHENWIQTRIPEAYKKIFGKSLEEYNQKQRETGHPERQIKSYYWHIKKNSKQHPAYEMIITIGNKENHPDPDVAKDIMKDFVDGWKARNPNLELVGAFYHQDEIGVAHVHVDYIPVAHGYKTGLEVQPGLVKALGEMGFKTESKKNTAQIQWERRENQHLEKLCRQRGIEIDHPMIEGRKHIETELYRARQELREAKERIITMEDKIKPLEAKYAAIKTVAEEGLDLNQVQPVKKIFDKKEYVQMPRDEYERLRKAAELLPEARAMLEKTEILINEFINAPTRSDLVAYLRQIEDEKEAAEQKVNQFEKAIEQLPDNEKRWIREQLEPANGRTVNIDRGIER